MVGRFGGAQVLKRGWMREAFLLSTALCGSVLCGIIFAIFSGQVLVAYAASVLVGCCQGPLEPSIMALTATPNSASSSPPGTRSPHGPKPSTTRSSGPPTVPPSSTGWKQQSTPTACPRDLPAGSASYTS